MPAALPYRIEDGVYAGVTRRLKVYPHGVTKFPSPEELAVWDALQHAERELAFAREQLAALSDRELPAESAKGKRR